MTKQNRKARRAAKSIERRGHAPLLDYSKPLPPFLDSDQFAELAHTSKRSIERWRREGTGPAFCRIGGKVVYSTETVLAWIKASERTSTSAAA